MATPPTLGDAILQAANRTAPLPGSGWRTSLYEPFAAASFVIEVEWNATAGLVDILRVPARRVAAAHERMLAACRPGFRLRSDGTNLGEPVRAATTWLEGEALVDAQRAWTIAAAVEDPDEPWLGRDGYWAETEVWDAGARIVRFGARHPVGDVPPVDAATRHLLQSCIRVIEDADVVQILAAWCAWCDTVPQPRRR